MNDLVAPEEVERRLQRTLARRAEDIVAGDGAGWDPVAAVSPLADRSTNERGLSVRALAAVAAVVVLVGTAAIGLSRMDRDDPSEPVVAADGGDSTVVTPPPTAPPTEVTSPPTAPPTGVTSPPTGPPTTAVPTPGQNTPIPVGAFRRTDGAGVRIEWYGEVALGWGRRLGSEDLQAGEYPANYWEVPDQRAYSLTLFFDDGVLYLNTDQVGMKDDLVAFAEGIRRSPGTTEFEVTPPAGYVPA